MGFRQSENDPCILKSLEMLHTIGLNETKTLTIQAREFYSSEKISVVADEKYEFSCPPDAHWVDWFVSSTPDGYFNLLSLMLGQRVKHTKCFCLCGAYNDNDDGAFAIGSTNICKMERTGTLSFFANDARNYYGNNKKAITVNIKRVL